MEVSTHHSQEAGILGAGAIDLQSAGGQGSCWGNPRGLVCRPRTPGRQLLRWEGGGSPREPESHGGGRTKRAGPRGRPQSPEEWGSPRLLVCPVEQEAQWVGPWGHWEPELTCMIGGWFWNSLSPQKT